MFMRLTLGQHHEMRMESSTDSKSKEEFIKEMRTLLSSVSQHTTNYNTLLTNLQQVARADVTFQSIEATKALIDESKKMQDVLKRVHKTLKTRALSRMKES